MTDIIKQIEEAYNTLDNDYILIDGPDGKEVDRARDTAMAALTVLQKIASGDDWFDIESAPKNRPIWGYCKNYDQHYLMKWNEQTTFFKAGWYHCTMVSGGYGSSNDTIIPFKDEQPTHWKPLDGAEHVRMLMEREFRNDKL